MGGLFQLCIATTCDCVVKAIGIEDKGHAIDQISMTNIILSLFRYHTNLCVREEYSD